MEEKKLDFQAKVEELVKEKGIAFGYKRNNTIELLDPDNMNMYTEPKQIYAEDGTAVLIHGQPLVFPNQFMAEGALAVVELMTGKSGLLIDRYNEKTTQLLVPYQYFGDPYPDLELFLQKSHYSILGRLRH